MKFYCPTCDNKDQNYFYKKGNGVYCRKCLKFIGKEANKKYVVKSGNYKLNYDLTIKQREASEFILRHIKENKTCALNAVCGAGKTEIIYDSIKYCLDNKMKIGIAIPRKDVVIELKERIEKDFDVSVQDVYGGNNSVLEADIVILTTHQAFRYIGYFDVLIVDEVDAFPYKNNDVLKNIVSKCSKVIIYMSATLPAYLEKDKEIDKFYLNKRYHNHDLPVPKCITSFNMLFTLKRYLIKYKNKIVIVYFPTIKIQNKISKKIKYNHLINSKIENRKEEFEKIRKLQKGVVLSTTVLERGITIKDVQVIVYNSDNVLFNEDTLIQIAGRVGRNKDFYKGDVIFICKNKTKNIKGAIKKIKKYNE